MKTELLPCPFCGEGESVVELWFDDVAHRYRVGCGRCGCSAGIACDKNESHNSAIAAWNRLAAQPAAQDGWRPIESAPKDGSNVDIWVEVAADCAPHMRAEIAAQGPHRVANTFYSDYRWIGGEWPWVPTHWQPLPPAPSQGN